MPVITNTDANWLDAYSRITTAALGTLSGVGLIGQADFTVTVSFEASEIFADFTIEFPFIIPTNYEPGLMTWTEANLSVTKVGISGSGTGAGAVISGTNLSAAPLTVQFNCIVFVSVPH